MSKLNKMIFIPCVSVDSNGDICTAIKDKGNGNIIAANDVDEDYEELFLSLPEMQCRLAKQQEDIEELVEALNELLNEAYCSADQVHHEYGIGEQVYDESITNAEKVLAKHNKGE